MGADDTQFASAFPSTKEALVKELGQQNLVNCSCNHIGRYSERDCSRKNRVPCCARFVSSSFEKFYRRWKRSHLDIILRQDLIDLENVRDIIKIETLIELLKTCVGSPVSFSSLARDLEKDPGTIKRWLSQFSFSTL